MQFCEQILNNIEIEDTQSFLGIGWVRDTPVQSAPRYSMPYCVANTVISIRLVGEYNT